MSDSVQYKLDSSQARADLAALAKSLEAVGVASRQMGQAMGRGADDANRKLVESAKNMEQFARVAKTVSQLKISGDPAKAVREFGNALNSLSRAKTVPAETLRSFTRFLEVGHQVSKLNFGPNAFDAVRNFSRAMDEAGRARAVRQDTLKSFVQFVEVAARIQKLRFNPQVAESLKGLGTALDGLSKTRGLTPAKIASLKGLFDTLANAKSVPRAGQIAADLDRIAASAVRAGAALKSLPTGTRALGGAFAAPAAGAGKLASSLKEMPEKSERARKGFASLGVGLNGLTGRFNVAYQAGTLFSAMFASFTFGQFVKGVYDTSVSMMKLEKGMFFVTGSFKEAHAASQRFLAMSNELGSRALANADAFSRFAISSAAIGASMSDVEGIYKATQTALTAVGATTQQAEYAFYGLSQAMAKGKISSEEFNRQIGEQIPGNVAAGVKALSTLEGKQLTANDLFDRMKAGAIQSLPFLREWAKEINNMFTQLLPLAEKRPDFQLNRLLNVWDVFKVAVGNSGFIGELTSQFKSLADQFVNADGTLNSFGTNLARSIGRGMADIVRATGKALIWVAENGDKVVGALKGLVALGLVHVFTQMAGSMTKFAEATIAQAKASGLAAKNLLTQASAAKAANAAMSAGPARLASVIGGGSGGTNVSVMGGPGMPANTGAFVSRSNPRFSKMQGDLFGSPGVTVVPEFGRRAAGTQVNGFDARGTGFWGSRVTDAVSGGLALRSMSPAAMGAGAAAAATKGLAAVQKGFLGLGRILPGVGTLLAGAGIAFALFGSKASGLKTAAGEVVTYNDIVIESFSEMGDAINGFISQITGGTVDVQSNGLGRVVALVMASVQTVVGGLFVLAKTLGTMLGGVIGDFVDFAITAAISISKALRLDFKGARETWAAGDKRREESNQKIRDGIASDFKVFDAGANYNRIMEGAAERANARKTAEQDSAAANKASADAEFIRQSQIASDKNLRAAADFESAVHKFMETVRPSSWEGAKGLESRITALLDGSFQKNAAAAEKKAGETAAKANATAALTPEQQKAGFALRGYQPGGAAGAKVQWNPDGTLASAGFPAASSAGSAMPATILKSIDETARRYSGLKEGKDGDKLQSLFSVAGKGNTVDPQKVAWCAAFVNAVLASNGLKGSTLRAADFKTFGQEVDKSAAQRGDVVVLKPQARGASGHVGFFDGYDDNGNVRVLGGNQGGGVNTSKFKASDIVSIRRANEIGDYSAGKVTVPGSDIDMTDKQEESLFNKRARGYDKAMQLMGQFDPIARAEATYESVLRDIQELVTLEEEVAKKAASDPDFKSIFEELGGIEKFRRIIEGAKREKMDAIDPLSKELRLLKASNEVLALRSKGLDDQANYQEYLNAAKEEGRFIDEKATRSSWEALKAEKDRTEVLNAQLDVVEALSDAKMASIGRTGNSYDRTLAELVNGKRLQGETYDQAATRLGNTFDADGNNALGALQEAAGVREGTRQQDAMHAMREYIDELEATARLDGTTRGYREDYKSFLTDLTGSVSSNLKVIENEATDTQKALAKLAADSKYAAEHPPGFQRWADGLEPLGERLEQIKAGFAEDLSGALTDALMGEDVDWSGLAKNFTRQLIKARVDESLKNMINGMNSGEGFFGSLKAAFGFGGAKAAPSSPEQIMSSASETQVSAATSFQEGVGTFGQHVQSLGQIISGAGGSNTLGGGAGSDTLGGLQSVAEAILPANDNGVVKNVPGLKTMPQVTGLDTTPKKPSIFQQAGNGLKNLFGGGNGPMAQAANAQFGGIASALGAVNTIADIAGVKKGGFKGYKGFRGEADKLPGWDKIKGIVGTMSSNDLTATAVGPKSNPIADGLNFALNMATGGSYGQYAGLGNMIGSTMGRFFQEGGLATNAVMSRPMHPSTWANAPHYAEGTHNTSGIPAILHPDEAVIPLSRGRKVPVEMAGGGGGGNVTQVNNWTIQTPDADSFRASQSTIQRKQNVASKRAALRNLHSK